ncbi:ATP-binding protein [Streptomyces sp. NBC_00481]|uniref:ATP-binding protein n=1 Tax=unclassified Streptomyces TaxID=2593676 RepID=UPI002DD87503|nr:MULTISPECIES: ATP-binding protein [unclassified Streptomyces]WRY98206.1 ATP-binding protein [Streptomyces sp. NBC_00481]
MLGCEGTEPRPRFVLPFEAVPAEVRLLRRAAVAQLGQWGMSVAADEVALLVTELATNVIKHVGEGVAATLILEWRSERLRVEVHDKSRAVPSLTAEGCHEECGRGLHLLGSLAADWGTALMAAGKAVWCEILLDQRGACRRIERAVEVLEGYQGVSGGAVLRGAKKAAGLEESAVELIADLLHWTAARGSDPDDILDRAQMHYEAEVEAA